MFGGDVPPATALTESWNGTNWTEVNDLNTARSNIAGSGISTATLAFGGWLAPGRTEKTEEWNGAGWAEVADLSTARYDTTAVGAGTTSDNLAIGGNTAPAQIADTEVWSGSTTVTKTVGTD